jgi:hypothetical protein
MPTTYKAPISTVQRDEPFFARPASRWFAMILLAATSALLVWVFRQSPSLEDALKACLFTIPATGFVLYRSFIRHE